ncbi:hypothetical protein WJX73_007385 [Symbiochloris irregularis]|uniref:SWIM-type domain-containing protein n=1 Tax=Symbiochloris irregularis TaxID=706552 RepID=A0AAW1NW21_9CHLO
MTSQLNEYEQQRERTIERNRARLLALGIPGLVNAVTEDVQKNSAPKKKAAKRKRDTSQPSRQSRRLHGEDAPEQDELALFKINGDCPFCGKVLQQGHKAHLERCIDSGRPRLDALREQANVEEDPLDAEELRQIELTKEAERIKRQDEKLHELELSGLVDFSEEHAEFMVQGSKGKHYKVALQDEKQTCQCMDYRLRRHACKHIRLVLTQLGIVDAASEWHEAVVGKLKQLESSDHPD